MCGQALVPLTGLLLWDGFHEVPLQLADTGVMPEQVLLRLIELLYGGKSRGKRQRAGGGDMFVVAREEEINKKERIKKQLDYVSFCCFCSNLC